MLLNDFACPCGYRDERLAPRGQDTLPCPECGGEARRLPARLQSVPNFGSLGAPLTRGTRLSPFERERREHWRETRGGGHRGADILADSKPKIFS